MKKVKIVAGFNSEKLELRLNEYLTTQAAKNAHVVSAWIDPRSRCLPRETWFAMVGYDA